MSLKLFYKLQNRTTAIFTEIISRLIRELTAIMAAGSALRQKRQQQVERKAKLAAAQAEVEAWKNILREAESPDDKARESVNLNPTPVGKGIFGNIYDQFKGKVKEALNFLMKEKSGDLLGVFYRDGLGDIDLVWGSREDKRGLDHSIEQHIERKNDFDSVEEAVEVIDDVIKHGKLNRENNDKIILDRNGYRVVIAKRVRDKEGNIVESKNWVVTAFDRSRSKKEKASSGETLIAPLSDPSEGANGVTLPLNDTRDKVNTSSPEKQAPAEESSPQDVDSAGGTRFRTKEKHVDLDKDKRDWKPEERTERTRRAAADWKEKTGAKFVTTVVADKEGTRRIVEGVEQKQFERLKQAYPDLELKEGQTYADVMPKVNYNETLDEAVENFRNVLAGGNNSRFMLRVGGKADGGPDREPWRRGEGGVRFKAMVGKKDEFKAAVELAHKARGIVAPDLENVKVPVISVSAKSLDTNKTTSEIQKWGRENLRAKYVLKDWNGDEFIYDITRDVSNKAPNSFKGNNNIKKIFLAVYENLGKVIGHAVETEVHADYLDKDSAGKRVYNDNYGKSKLIHRYYAAVDVDGQLARVKITVPEELFKHHIYPHNVEIMKDKEGVPPIDEMQIELLPYGNNPKHALPGGDSGDYAMAKVWNISEISKSKGISGYIPGRDFFAGIKKSYDSGKDLLEARAEASAPQSGSGGTRMRVKEEYDPRAWIGKTRGKWSKEKIKRKMKGIGMLTGVGNAAKLISEFDSPEEFAEHMFYHGTQYGSGALKPSIMLKKSDVERFGGGGYGAQYWGISVSRSKKKASNFSQGRGVRIYPIVLAKNAKVIERPDFTDAYDLESHIENLWAEGVDAVWIGNGKNGGGEQELCIINPAAAVNIDVADYYQYFNLGKADNPLRIVDEAGVRKIFETALEYREMVGKKPTPPKFTPPRYYDEEGNLRPDDVINQEWAEYVKKRDEYRNSDEFKSWKADLGKIGKGIRFRTGDGRTTSEAIDDYRREAGEAQDGRRDIRDEYITRIAERVFEGIAPIPPPMLPVSQRLSIRLL